MLLSIVSFLTCKPSKILARPEGLNPQPSDPKKEAAAFIKCYEVMRA